MKTSDVMTRRVISVRPETTVKEAAEIMLREHISGLPVIAADGALVGIVTEGDLMRRVELGTEKRRPRWLAFLACPTREAQDYVHTHSRVVANVMTWKVRVVTEDMELADAVSLMEKAHIKRVPVVRDRRVIGILTRANLVRALVAAVAESPGSVDDEDIRGRLESVLAEGSWSRHIHGVVHNRIVDLWGVVFDEAERRAARTAAENTAGVKAVRDHLAWIEPNSGLILNPGGVIQDAAAAERPRA